MAAIGIALVACSEGEKAATPTPPSALIRELISGAVPLGMVDTESCESVAAGEGLYRATCGEFTFLVSPNAASVVPGDEGTKYVWDAFKRR